MTLSVSTLLCPVQNMDRAVSFYTSVFGVDPVVVSPYWSEFHVGGMRVGLHPPLADGDSGAGWVVCLSCEDLLSFRTRLDSLGVWRAKQFHDIPGGCVLDFHDPDGNPLQAMQSGVASYELAG